MDPISSNFPGNTMEPKCSPGSFSGTETRGTTSSYGPAESRFPPFVAGLPERIHRDPGS